MAPNRQKKQIYSWIKIGGFIGFIPAILALGPLAGYYAGEYLEKRFNLPSHLPFLLAAFGFIASVNETIRIIRLIIKMDKKD
ncbi:MAG TPA: hypothetical protein PL155_08860 [Candidatus Omnitrophota bacterium]|nr:hypothetical protein [Candidatus Omnitrophota bacterium]HPD85434.1 hypothetical protein [Candidatus Omnitrophota bacterium]HRZ04065.1 hypothetical protein [Candidatus Omnitrophota bacterium]